MVTISTIKRRTEIQHPDKEHDFKECQNKNPFYLPSEIKILESVNRPPTPRKNWPEDGKYITKETEWIKRLMEKNTPSPNAGSGQSKIQATSAENPNGQSEKQNYNRRRNQNNNNTSNTTTGVDSSSSKK